MPMFALVYLLLAVHGERIRRHDSDFLEKEVIRHSPFTDGYRDECPSGLSSSPAATTKPASEQHIFTVVAWNVEWAYAPDGERVRWLREKVKPGQANGDEGYKEVLECPEDWESANCLNATGRAGRKPCSSCASMWTHLQRLSTELANMSALPDVVVLPEVDGCRAVTHLQKDLKELDPAYEPYLIYGSNDRTNSQTGLISRIPPETPLWMSGKTFETPAGSNGNCSARMGAHGSDKHFVAELNVDGVQIFVIGVHLKSMRQDNKGEACSVREAEAKVLSDLLDELFEKNPSAEVIVTGDFNDFDPETPDRKGAFSAAEGKTFPVREFEDCFRGKCRMKEDEGYGGQNSAVFDIIKGHGPRPRLVNLLSKLPREQRYSHEGSRHSGFPSTCGFGFSKDIPRDLSSIDCPSDGLLDHALATPGLVDAAITISILNDFEEVYKGKKPKELGWAWPGGWSGNKLGKLRPKHESDHWPLFFQFDVSRLRK